MLLLTTHILLTLQHDKAPLDDIIDVMLPVLTATLGEEVLF